MRHFYSKDSTGFEYYLGDVTHDQEEAMTLSDRIVVMNQGAIEQVGTPEEIYARPKTRFVLIYRENPQFRFRRGAREGRMAIGVKVWDKILRFERAR